MTFRLRHLLGALALHVVLLGVLAGGLQCSRKPERPPVIRAVLLDPDRKEVTQQKKRDEQRAAEQRRKAEQEKKKREDAARRKVEEDQKRREAEEAQRQKQLADQKKAEEARRQKELAEQKKAEEAARKKQEQEALRERQEQAQREVQDKARMEEALRQEALRREVEREQAARAASEREARQGEWILVLQRHVQKHWLRPGSATTDFQCTVRVQLLPDGTVTSASMDRRCGNAALDKSVEDAVFRASPLPRPADPSVFDRELIINFEPGP